MLKITAATNAALWFLLLVMPLCCGSTIVVQAPACDVAALPYRGKVIDDNDSSEEIYRQYQEKLREYQDMAFSKTSDWKTLKKTTDGIEISTLTSNDDKDCPYVRMKATMPTSAVKLYKFMSFSNWKVFMPIINPFYQGMSVMNEFTFQNTNMVMARKHSTSILGFGRRDFSILAITSDPAPRGDGVLVSGTISVIAPQQIPRYQGFTRAFQDMVCFYKPVGRNSDGSDQTELTIMLRTDLNDSTDGGTGGSVPMWLVVKTLGIAGSKAMQGLRKIVRKQSTALD